jgi:hypothetical protein
MPSSLDLLLLSLAIFIMGIGLVKYSASSGQAGRKDA